MMLVGRVSAQGLAMALLVGASGCSSPESCADIGVIPLTVTVRDADTGTELCDATAIPFPDDGDPRAWWVDLTSSDVKAWLQSAATNHAPSPENVRWRGETDYTGPCNTAHDFDCDGFLNRDA